MASSLTALSNKALRFAGSDNTLTDVTDTTDDSKEAEACRAYIDDVQRELLEELDWQFAHNESILSTHADDPPQGWSYRYNWPSACLVPRDIMVEDQAVNIDHEDYVQHLSEDGSEMTLCTNLDGAYLGFTSDAVLDLVDRWPYNFREAFTFKLAANLALELGKSMEKHDKAMERYARALNVAWSVDNAGRRQRNHQNPRSVRART